MEIRKNLRLLQQILQKSSDELPLVGLGKARKVGTFFLDDCHIVLGAPVPDIHSKSELVAIVHQARKSLYRARVGFLDISISISDDRTNASVSMTATATVYEDSSLAREVEAREVEVTWVKIDRSWKINQVRTIKTLR